MTYHPYPGKFRVFYCWGTLCGPILDNNNWVVYFIPKPPDGEDLHEWIYKCYTKLDEEFRCQHKEN